MGTLCTEHCDAVTPACRGVFTKCRGSAEADPTDVSRHTRAGMKTGPGLQGHSKEGTLITAFSSLGPQNHPTTQSLAHTGQQLERNVRKQ